MCTLREKLTSTKCIRFLEYLASERSHFAEEKDPFGILCNEADNKDGELLMSIIQESIKFNAEEGHTNNPQSF